MSLDPGHWDPKQELQYSNARFVIPNLTHKTDTLSSFKIDEQRQSINITEIKASIDNSAGVMRQKAYLSIEGSYDQSHVTSELKIKNPSSAKISSKILARSKDSQITGLSSSTGIIIGTKWVKITKDNNGILTFSRADNTSTSPIIFARYDSVNGAPAKNTWGYCLDFDMTGPEEAFKTVNLKTYFIDGDYISFNKDKGGHCISTTNMQNHCTDLIKLPW